MTQIKPLTLFFSQAINDTGLSPTHLSLFMALFQRWHQAHFETSIQISRDDIMQLAKVQSRATYHRAMRYLHEHRYIDYQPSYNPIKGSCIRFFPGQKIPSPPANEPVQSMTRLIKEPYISLYTNNQSIEIDKKDGQKTVRSIPDTAVVPVPASRFEKEKSSAKKEKEIPPAADLVERYFLSEGSTAAEAQRFINHYSANGWLVGGKSPMMDWKASARNWMSNDINNRSHGKNQNAPRAQQLNTRTDKSYHEPL